MGKFLFFALVIDASIEGLDWVHRLYSADESIHVLKSLAEGKLFYTLLVVQACLGTAVPLLLLGVIQLLRQRFSVVIRQRIYFATSVFVLLCVLAMSWNVVIGGEPFSNSLPALTTYKME